MLDTQTILGQRRRTSSGCAGGWTPRDPGVVRPKRMHDAPIHELAGPLEHDVPEPLGHGFDAQHTPVSLFC